MRLSEMRLDMEAGFTENMFRFVDTEIGRIHKFIQDGGHDLDTFGDDFEYLHGIGFIAGQHYIKAACAELKVREPFDCGPKLSNGITYASVINAAANYWKHSEEWNPDLSKLKPIQESTRKVIENAGVDVSGGYVTSNVLGQLGLKTFSALSPILKEWSAALLGREDSQPS